MKHFFAILLSFLVSFSFAKSNEIEDIKRNLPQLMASAGTEYYLTFHPSWEIPGNNPIRIYVGSTVATNVTLEVEAINLSETKTTIPNDLIEFVLAPSQAQMYSKTDRQPPQNEKVWFGRAIHITANSPIVVYGVSHFNYTSDGFLALPISHLRNSYIISSWADPVDVPDEDRKQWLTSYTSIVGVYDNTNIHFVLGGVPNTTTPGGMIQGRPYQEVLNAGDVWLIPAKGPAADLSGSVVNSSKPIGVISGSFCAYIPEDVAACDYLIEQELPTDMWGKEYFLTPIINRRKNSWIKIYPKERTTTVYRDGEELATIKNAGGLIDDGFIKLRAADGDKKPIVFTADKPISITQFNPGQLDDNIPSDPFQMVLFPREQFINHAYISTPGRVGGSGFDNDYINVVYQSDDDLIPIDIEIGKQEEGSVVYKKLRDLADTTYKFSYQLDSKDWYGATYRLPERGLYSIRSENKIGIYQYGFSSYNSYGMPGMMSLPYLASDTTAPKIEYSVDCQGNVPAIGDQDFANGWARAIDWAYDYTKTSEDNQDVRSNMSQVILDETVSENYTLTVNTFIAGEDRQADWKLEVNNPIYDAKAVVYFSDNNNNISEIEVNYIAMMLEFEPSFIFLDEENEYVTSLNFTNGTTTDYTINSLEFQSEELQFSGIELPYQLSAGSSISIEFSLKDPTTTIIEENVTLVYTELENNCSKTIEIPVSVNIDPIFPVITVDDLNFDEEVVNQSSEYKQLFIHNLVENGSLSEMEIYGIMENNLVGKTGSGKVFEVDGFENVGTSNPIIVPKDSSYPVSVRFTPSQTIEYDAELVFATNADKINEVSKLSGVGVVKSELLSKNEWGSLKADPNFYKKDLKEEIDYSPQSIGKAIYFENNSGKNLTISDVIIRNNLNGDDYLVESDEPGVFKSLLSEEVIEEFKNLTIPSGGFYEREVFIHPKKSGYHIISIQFVTNIPVDYVFEMEGIATVPSMRTDKEYVLMGSLPNSDGELLNSVTILTNNSLFNDNVTIFGIEEITDDEISLDWNTYNDKNFKIDLPQTFPYTIKKGESLRLNLAYKNNGAGNYAELRTISDANEEITISIVADDHQSIDDAKQFESYSIYPNPVKDQLSIKFKKYETDLKFVIYDINGKEIANYETNSPIMETTIPVEFLIPGVYFLKTIGNEINETKSFTKE